MDSKDTFPKRPRQSRWYVVLVVALAAVLLYLAVREVSWAEMAATFRQGRVELFVVVFFLNSLAIFGRGVRWGVLLSAEKKISPWTMFWAASIGYMGNTFLPARAGEVIRSVTLGRKTGVSMSYVLATALTERVMDVLALVLIVLMVTPSLQGLPEWLPGAVRVMAALGVAAIVLVVLAPRLEKIFKRILAFLPMPERWRQPANHLLEQFLLGTQALVHPGRAGGFIGLTAAIWLVDALGSITMAAAFGLTLTLPQALLFLSALGLSSAVPSTPGYVGVYQFVAVTVLPAFGLSESQALLLILAAQAINILAIVVWGLVGLWRLGRWGHFRPDAE